MEISCEGTCNNSSADSVTIPRDRYEELIDMVDGQIIMLAVNDNKELEVM